jgi:putative oxidoreductase
VDLAIFVLRVVAGLLFAGHGAQKLFGIFGGNGLRATAEGFDKMGLRPGRLHATLAGTAEFFGGLLLAAGLFVPIAAAALIGVMTAAIWTVHLKKGIWVTEGGFEYNLVLIAIAFALTALGAGSWSLDHALGIDWTGDLWALSVLAAGLIGGAGAVITGRLYASRDPQKPGGHHPHPVS